MLKNFSANYQKKKDIRESISQILSKRVFETHVDCMGQESHIYFRVSRRVCYFCALRARQFVIVFFNLIL